MSSVLISTGTGIQYGMLHTYPYPALNIHADSDPGGHRIMHTDPIPGCLLTRGETKKNVVHLLLLDQQKLAAWLFFFSSADL